MGPGPVGTKGRTATTKAWSALAAPDWTVAHAEARRLAGNGAGRTAQEDARPRAPRHLQELDAAAALAAAGAAADADDLRLFRLVIATGQQAERERERARQSQHSA